MKILYENYLISPINIKNMENFEKKGVIFFHPDFLLADAFYSSSEGGRMALITERLNLDGLWGEQIVEADMAPLKRIKDIHDENFLTELHKKITHGAEKIEENTPVMEKSFEIARRAAGGLLDAIDLIMKGEVSSAFCLSATPGHFAGVSLAKGGSLVNYSAIGAHFLTKKYCLQKVAIIDLDASHFSGTQEIFWKRKDVLTISLHEYPAYPGSGHYSETGDSPARGLTVNVPIPSGYGDREYLSCIREIITPMVKQFEPQFIILSLGTNVLAGDPSYHLLVSEAGLLAMVGEIRNLARAVCKGKMVSVLEGGSSGKLMSSALSKVALFLLNNLTAPTDKEEKREIISFADWYSYSKVLKNHFRKFWRI
ncbi:MAG: histone deacetylase [Candidatus Riflebacteria bacterium]|nr:histone deacetylase [Candidatus Riflebacteria bacterium]